MLKTHNLDIGTICGYRPNERRIKVVISWTFAGAELEGIESMSMDM